MHIPVGGGDVPVAQEVAQLGQRATGLQVARGECVAHISGDEVSDRMIRRTVAARVSCRSHTDTVALTAKDSRAVH